MSDDHVRVSMYNVGFGDCFLLRFPAPDRERKVLIDCGSIKRPTVDGRSIPIGEVVAKLVGDVTEDGTPRIDVVAVSHRHEDHVSGFLDPIWNSVQVDEVWLPWTEDADDPKAARLLNEMSSFALALNSEFHALAGVNALGPEATRFVEHVLENFFGESPSNQINGNPLLSLKNDEAMGTLLRGFAGGAQGAKREYMRRLPAGQPYRTDALPGVDVHVLGPSDEESVIAAMHPPSDESFLRGVAVSTETAGAMILPFPVSSTPQLRPDQSLLDLLERITSTSTVLGAAALESAVNNTSLMLAFELGDALLLFPGDSQWGSWRVNRDDAQHRDLLRRCTFYKVGHHGSHNASPRFFLEDERMIGLWGAAISVTPHGRFTSIPKPELEKQLRAKLTKGRAAPRLVRSDTPPSGRKVPKGVEVVDDLRVDFEVPIRNV